MIELYLEAKAGKPRRNIFPNYPYSIQEETDFQKFFTFR